MSKLAKEDKTVPVEQLNKEHYTLLDAFETIQKSGIVKILCTLIIAAVVLIWRVEVLNTGVSSMSSLVDRHDTAISNHRTIVYSKYIPFRDTIIDTIDYRIVEIVSKPEEQEEVRRSPYGGPLSPEE